MPVTYARKRNESSLHASLKQHYACDDARVEQVVDGYRIDVVRPANLRESPEPLLIEVQTRSFSAIRPKLCALLATHRVRLVYPIACEKWIVKVTPDGSPISRKRSPKHGCLPHLFDELISFPALMAHPNLTLDVVLTREEEIRCNDGKGSRRRGGWSVLDRRLMEVIETTTFAQPADFLKLLPTGLPAPFTARDLASAMQRSVPFARRAAYCLRKMGALHVIGKRRRAWLYALPTDSKGLAMLNPTR
jgi:hypothetical protein